VSLRFLLDEDVHPEAASAARKLGLDVVSVHELGRRGKDFSDAAQLRHAAAEGRTMVTRNRDDFIRLTREFFRTGEAHHGLVIIPHTLPNSRPGRIARAVKKWSEGLPGGESGHYLIHFLQG
jgi:hypothetical protein